MIVTISFNALGGEIISGIPRFIEIQSSQPATIYYTLDGSLPSQLSSAYTSAIEIPTNQNSVTLSAVGYFLDGYNNLVPTPILSNIYSTDTSEILDSTVSSSGNTNLSGRARFLFFEGIVYIFPGGANIPFWYDSSGQASVFLDVPAEELDFLVSNRNIDGSHRETPFDVGRIPAEDTASLWDDDYQIFDTPTSDTFNPEALYILIDGRNGDSLESTLLINGPHMDLRNPRRNYQGLDFYSLNNTNYRAGNMQGYHFDREKGIIVFYYNDTNSGRWIKSIQNLDHVDTRSLPKPFFTNPIVFKWFNFGRHSSI